MESQGLQRGDYEDALALEREFGYKQELPRVLKLWSNFAIGFAFISPVVGTFTSFLPSAVVAGPVWVWAIPVVIVGQGIVGLSYSSLATKWPIAGGLYQWSKRLVGVRYGWWGGWFYAWALILSESLTCYTGAIFLGNLINVNPNVTSNHIYLAIGLLAFVTFFNFVGLRLLKYAVNAGIAAETIATVTVGFILLVFFRHQPVHALWTGDIPAFGGQLGPALLASIALTAWLIVGFDACGNVAEETHNPKRQVPRAIFYSIICVGAIDLLAGFSFTLATPGGNFEGDPVTTSVITSFGAWAQTPYLIIVLISFTACCIATQGAAARCVFSLSRDEQYPGGKLWKRVTKWNQSPTYAVLLVAVLAILAFLYSEAQFLLNVFTADAYYLAFFFPLAALFVKRWRGQWEDDAQMPFNLGRRWNLIVNGVAVVWLAAQIVNIAWPRWEGEPWYNNYGAILGMGAFGVVGLAYFVISRPYRRAPRLAAQRGPTPVTGQEVALEADRAT